MARYRGEHRYDYLVRSAGFTHGVPQPLIKAVIGAESGYDPKAFRAEPAIFDASRGLMQLLEKTSRSLGFRGDVNMLFDPSVNIDLGSQLLTENYKHARAGKPEAPAGELWEIALSAYNAGWSRERPNDAKRDRDGSFVNQPYVDKVLRLTRYFGGVGGLRVPRSPASVPLTIVGVAALAALYWWLF